MDAKSEKPQTHKQTAKVNNVNNKHSFIHSINQFFFFCFVLVDDIFRSNGGKFVLFLFLFCLMTIDCLTIDSNLIRFEFEFEYFLFKLFFRHSKDEQTNHENKGFFLSSFRFFVTRKTN